MSFRIRAKPVRLGRRASDRSIGGCKYQSDGDLLWLADPITFVRDGPGVFPVSDFLVGHGGKLFLATFPIARQEMPF
jgi:hypothetical protein